MTTPESPNSRLYAAWFENIAVAEDHPDRVYFIVEATERHAQMSAHHEVEESGPEVGLPAKRVMTSPVQAYVREDVAEAAVAVQGRELAWRVEAMKKREAETTALRRERDAVVETTLTAMLEELRKRGWECPGGLDGDDHAVCASRVRQALTAK